LEKLRKSNAMSLKQVSESHKKLLAADVKYEKQNQEILGLLKRKHVVKQKKPRK
jgi:hypothetical protein